MKTLTDPTLPTQPPAELLEALNYCRRPLIIAHLAPDGDAIGSLLALGNMLHRLGKDPILACQDPPPASLRFLPGSDRITNDVRDYAVDQIIAIDSSDPTRMGSIYDPGEHKNLPLLVIDHHVTNVAFGQINWVEPTTAATAQMMYDLALALDIEIKADLATCMLTGMVTDTRGFRTNNTTARVLDIAAALMQAGASLNRIMERTLNSHSFNLIQLWGRALETVEFDRGVIHATNSLVMREGLDGIVRPEGLTSFILGAYEAKAAVVFTELPENKVECSFRARPGQNIAEVAFALGGGGHPLAAGCTISGRLPEIKELVLSRLIERVLSS